MCDDSGKRTDIFRAFWALSVNQKSTQFLRVRHVLTSSHDMCVGG